MPAFTLQTFMRARSVEAAGSLRAPVFLPLWYRISCDLWNEDERNNTSVITKVVLTSLAPWKYLQDPHQRDTQTFRFQGILV